jgi:hypothetical protein
LTRPFGRRGCFALPAALARHEAFRAKLAAQDSDHIADVVALLCAVVPVRQTLRNIVVKSIAHLRQGFGLLGRELDGDADGVGWS